MKHLVYPFIIAGFAAGLAPHSGATFQSGPADSSTVSFTTLLNEMVDRDSIARYPDPAYTCKQFSSYDRAAVSPDENWFANGDADKYLRSQEINGRTEWVMMDAKGPGAVVRIWSANPPGDGMMRVYIDGAAEPVIEAAMTDILGSKWEIKSPLSAVRSRGWNLYLPIPYSQHCLITCDKRGFYYQINYRTYDHTAEIESFGKSSLKDNRELLSQIQEKLSNPKIHYARDILNKAIEVHRQSLTIQPGDTLDLLLPNGARAVRGLFIAVDAENLSDALRQTVLKAQFDGQDTIWCPVGDFLGSGIGINDFGDWYRSPLETGNGGISYWIMPYAESGKFCFTNYGSEPVTLTVEAVTTVWSWDSRSMHFYTRWRQQNPINTRPMIDWNYINIKGKGVFVGDTLALANPVKTWWGEGDEKIYTDGETFPSHFGTGTEDYYGYAWGSPEPFKAPFHSQPRCDGPGNYGHTTVSRVRSLDGIPFESDFRFDMEVWHWKDCQIGYAATTHFYAMGGVTHNRSPMPKEAARGALDPPPLPPPFRIEGALEADKLKIVNRSEGYSIDSQGGFGENLWSGDKHLWSQSKQIGDFLELEIPAQGDTKKRIFVHATKSWDYAIVRFFINGKRSGKDVDLYNTNARAVIATGPIDLGLHSPTDGSFILRIEVVGSNQRSEGLGTFYGIDCVLLKDE